MGSTPRKKVNIQQIKGTWAELNVNLDPWQLGITTDVGNQLVYRDDINIHVVLTTESSISDLSDVVVSNPANGEFLKFNGSVWTNQS